MLKYDTVEDATMRLNNTIVRYAGRPVHIVQVFKKRNSKYIWLKFEDLYDNNTYDVKLDDDKWNFASPPLGYIQHTPDSSVYLLRLPERKQAQGLHIERIYYTTNSEKGLTNLMQYPNYRDVRFAISNDYSSACHWFDLKNRFKRFSLAISRDLCLTSTSLFFHCHSVGSIEQTDDREATIHITKRLFKPYPLEDILNAPDNWRIDR